MAESVLRSPPYQPDPSPLTHSSMPSLADAPVSSSSPELIHVSRQSSPSWSPALLQSHLNYVYPAQAGALANDHTGGDAILQSREESQSLADHAHTCGSCALACVDESCEPSVLNIPRTPLDARLPLSLPCRSILEAKEAAAATITWRRDPHLHWKEILRYLRKLRKLKRDGFHVEHPIPGVIPVPCISDMPRRYRHYEMEEPLSIPDNPMNPWVFYEFCLWFRLADDDKTLLSASNRLPVCTTNSFNVFRDTWEAIRDHENPDIARLAWGPQKELIAKIQELTGLFFLDSKVYASHLIASSTLPTTMELGMLSGDYWLR
ncbi:hypothetical protein PQX77_007170 [Marasmius sp. AFHP31]|nr:hypothetical protein PQX77_007170 [Marasmius sp. AFHP31]